MNRRGMLISGLAAAGAAVVVIAIVASSGGFGSGSRHVVPDLRGLRLDVADAKLDTIGLDSDTKGGGTFGVVVRSHWRVCDQEPRAGVTAADVLLIVDRDCEWTVPDVTGLRLKAAEAALVREGTPYRVTYPGAPRSARHGRFLVCEQDPQYGSASEPVDLSANRVCQIPDVTDTALPVAIAKLRNTGLGVAAFNDAGARVRSGRWRVCDQAPGPGDSGSRVRLTVYRTCSVPDVTGLLVGRALKQLKTAGVVARALDDFGRLVTTGRSWVCTQDAPAFEAASRVTLTVSPDCGAPTDPTVTGAGTPLPYLENYSLDYARTSLGDLGVPYRLVISYRSRRVDSSVLVVCHQVPEAGSGVAEGRAAVLYVAADCYTEWPGAFRR
jgi:beta-lactam-binding protein with PASTA domain